LQAVRTLDAVLEQVPADASVADNRPASPAANSPSIGNPNPVAVRRRRMVAVLPEFSSFTIIA
jgi:hypothetical protein